MNTHKPFSKYSKITVRLAIQLNEEVGLSHRQVAKQLHIPKSTVFDWISGKTRSDLFLKYWNNEDV